jgi:endoglucanase
MRFNVTSALIASLGLSLSVGACIPKVDPKGEAVKSSPEGRACPKEIGLISDGENNSNQIADIQGRGGYWYTFLDDGGSTVVPEAGKNGGTFQMSPGGADGSKFAAHMSGTVGTGGGNVYVGMGLNFVDPKGTYDASKYKGITFKIKKGPGSHPKVRLKVPDTQTDPEGKKCTECFNDFGLDMELTDDWKTYTIPFRTLKQIKGWGSRFDGIDTTAIYGLQWQVNDPGAAFDVWVDDIAFTGCGG